MNVFTILRAADPMILPGWEAFEGGASFYASARWLAYADIASGAASEYFLASADGLPAAAVSIHRIAGGFQGEYDPTAMIPGASLAENATLIGGYRGFRSSALRSSRPDAADAMVRLIDEAVPREPWWWPHLTTADASFIRRAFAAKGRQTALNLVGVDHSVRTPASFEAHIDSLPSKQRRTNARREIAKTRERALRIRRMRLSESWQNLVPLLAEVESKYGQKADLAHLHRLVGLQAERLDDIAVLFGCEDAEGQLVGFSLSYLGASELTLRIVGFNYERLRGGEYAVLAIYEPIAYAANHGIPRVHLGVESDEAKARRGSMQEPLWAVSSHGTSAQAESRARAEMIAARLPPREATAFLQSVHATLAMV